MISVLHPKFVQIAIAYDPENADEILYALDDEGHVWYYRDTDHTWYKVSGTRG